MSIWPTIMPPSPVLHVHLGTSCVYLGFPTFSQYPIIPAINRIIMFHNFVILYDSYKYHFYKIIPSGTSWSSSKLGSNWSNCGNFSVRGKTNASDSVSVSDRCEIRREIVASESELISSTYLKYNNRYFGSSKWVLSFVSCPTGPIIFFALLPQTLAGSTNGRTYVKVQELFLKL